MGLHSPFGYVGYEVPLAELFIDILDKLCAHCHTNEDYQSGCKSCPAGILAFECRDYLSTYDESDKRFELYASDEWAEKRKEIYGREDPPEMRQKDAEMAQDYKPECDILRILKQKIKRITPHPFFYVKHGKRGYGRPKVLDNFVELVRQYSELRKVRLQKWGLWVEGKVSA